MENQSIRHKKGSDIGKTRVSESKHLQTIIHEKFLTKRRDVIFLGILFIAATAFLLWFLLGYRDKGMLVEVTIDGEVYGTYFLDEEQEISIEKEGNTTNILLIEDGKADMIWGDCPDKICVHQAAISNVGETIVCLPNKVVVTVVNEDK